MSQDVTRQIDRLRRRLQWRRVLIASCWFLVVVTASVLILSATDWLLGVGDLAGRVVGTIALGGSVAFAVRHWWREVWQRRVTLVSVSHRIERRNPALRDIVTSALQFNQQSSSVIGAGSESLRRAVVLRAAASVHEIDWRQLVSPLVLRRAITAAIVVLLGIAGMMWQAPQVVSTGLTRLLNPMSTAEWPRVNDLQLLNPPLVLAAGEDLVLQLRDSGGLLPAWIDVQTRVKRYDRWEVESQTFAAGGRLQEVRVANIQDSMEYRATGGDHRTMRWHALEVVSPPRVSKVQVTVLSPKYTGRSKSSLEAAESLLLGTRLWVEGSVSYPVSSVVLRGTNGWAIPAILDGDGKTFRTRADGWQIESSEVVSFEITTDEGLVAQAARRLMLEVVDDRSPRVAIVEPAQKLSVTPAAVVPVIVDVRDDLAIRNIQLVYRRTDRLQEGERQLTIFEGPKSALSTPDGRHRRVEYLWQLESLGLKPGNVVEVHAEASDYRPAIGKTEFPRRLLVVSEDELLSQIAVQEATLIEILLRLRRQQVEWRNQTTSWATQAYWDGQRWSKEFGELLSRQRHISEVLANDRGGVIVRLKKIVADFERNGLYRPESMGRLTALQRVLDTLVKEPLPAIEQLLADWVRSNSLAGDPLVSKQKRHEIVDAVAQRQQEVIELLQQAVDQLTWENTLARYENEVAALQAAQGQLAGRSGEGVQSEVTGIAEAKNQRGWQEAKNQQRRLSRDLAKMVRRMSRSANQQLAIAGQLSGVVSLAQELGVQATMQTAADHLGERRLGEALSLQRQAIADLQTMRGLLAGEQSDGQKQVEANSEGASKGEQGSQAGEPEQPNGSAVAGASPKESTRPDGRPPETQPAGAATVEGLVRDLWGHLPARQREEILQPLNEKFLPEYAPEIEAYFRALAEPEGAR